MTDKLEPEKIYLQDLGPVLTEMVERLALPIASGSKIEIAITQSGSRYIHTIVKPIQIVCDRSPRK